MTQSIDERLYNLLPAIYRVRDAAQGEPLRALMAVLQSEFDRLKDDIDGLYDDWFIETCAEWVIPYIGDLLGVRNLHSVGSAGIFSQRAYVANTLRYRRRKGTAPVLEQLARDVTGWPARAVEFFERLVTTQHLNHPRPHSQATVDLRSSSRLELLGGPFENAAHTAEARNIASSRGRYNIPNIGLFLWRLQSYFVALSVPSAVVEPADGRYSFSPLGNDAPLFNRPQTEVEIIHLADEINVPDTLRRRALYDDLEAYRNALVTGESAPSTEYFGSQPVIQVFFDDMEKPLLLEEIIICDLSEWDIPGWQPPASQTIARADSTTFQTRAAVDPALGRLAILGGIPVPTQAHVSYAYGFSSDIGGGPYSRRETLAQPSSLDTWARTVSQQDAGADFSTLTDALADWAASGSDEAIITIADDGTYPETIAISMTGDRALTIQSADGQRPLIRLVNEAGSLADLTLTGSAGSGASLSLNGLLVEGGILVEADSLGLLSLAHCTLVPGRRLNPDGQPRRPGVPSIVVANPNANLRVEITHSIVGPLLLPEEIAGVYIEDSVVQSPSRGGPASRSLALVSGDLTAFPTLSAGTPSVAARIGGEGPHTAAFASVPADIEQARQELEAAIRAAHPSNAFAEARVVASEDRLIVIPGVPEAVTIENANADLTATELKLNADASLQVETLLSGGLSPFPILTSPAPSMSVTMGDEGPHVATLASVPASLTEARDLLQAAIRAAHASPAFQEAIVAILDDQLVVMPGAEDTPAIVGTTSADQQTLFELGFQEDRPALAASADGSNPGPPSSFERTTVFGRVHVREIDIASETIFADPMVARRRQVGCARFCYLPEGSRAPRRFRCQPDLTLEGVTDPAQRESILTRLTPSFTSERYGHPAYAQLSLSCAGEIRAGAEDGSEMGVFSHLKQPQREANLHASLEEYLRFGLQAGIFYVT